MSFDSLLKKIGLRKKSLAEKVNDKIIAGYKPSSMAELVVGKVSSRKFNTMMDQARVKYNRTHEVKVFSDE